MGGHNQTSERTGNAPCIKVISAHFRKEEKQKAMLSLTFGEPKKTLMYTEVFRARAPKREGRLESLPDSEASKPRERSLC